MATITRAPFYVPRAGDEAYWQWGSQRSEALLPLLTAVKEFGAGGEVPTKRWRWDPSIDEPLWLGVPDASASIVLTTTQQKLYGKPGQVQAKQWRWDPSTDEPIWQGQPDPAA